jgi:hypothetical protein
VEYLVVLCVVVLIALFYSTLWAWALLAFGWFVGLGLIAWTISHPIQAVGYVAGYLLVGAIWSVIKWWFRETAIVREAKQAIKDGHSPHGTYTFYKTFDEYRKSHKSKVSDHKSDFSFWIGFWPLNMVWTIIDDPLTRAVKRIYLELHAVYQRITDSVWN